MRVRPLVSAPGFWLLGETPSYPDARSPGATGGTMNRLARTLAALSLAAAVSGCAGMLRSPDIADVRQNSGHYSNRTVTVDGTVTSAWGVPLVPFKMYKVDDGTGEITVLSRGGIERRTGAAT